MEITVSLVFIFIGALAVTRWYVEYELPTLVHGLQCDGNESAVLNCSTSLTSDGSCSTSSDASVICPGTYAFYYNYIVDREIFTLKIIRVKKFSWCYVFTVSFDL